jgi:hypothetical protein
MPPCSGIGEDSVAILLPAIISSPVILLTVPFVVVNLVNEDFINPVHDGVSFLRTV